MRAARSTIDGDLAAKAIERGHRGPLGIAAASGGGRHHPADGAEAAARRAARELRARPRSRGGSRSLPRAGPGPLHGAAVARALGCRRVYCRACPVRSAHSACCTPTSATTMSACIFDELDSAETETAGGRLRRARAARRRATLAREGFTRRGRCGSERALDLRYIGQQWDITVLVGRRLRSPGRFVVISSASTSGCSGTSSPAAHRDHQAAGSRHRAYSAAGQGRAPSRATADARADRAAARLDRCRDGLDRHAGLRRRDPGRRPRHRRARR